MSTIDVVARLQLRAEQFSSETGARFAEMKTRARSAAQDVRDSFAGSMAEVQRLTSQALNVPRTAGGALDLSGEIASLKSASVEADRHAQALRDLSIAQTNAAASGRVDAEAMKQEADASAVGALASERQAQSIRDRIIALEAVQRELNQATGATELNSAAQRRNTAVSGQHRASMQNLGAQFTDFSVQVLSGQSAFTAFAQQAPQAGAALAGFQGKLGLVGAALTGPAGIAGTIALSALGILGAKLLEVGDATEKAVKQLKEDAAQTDATRRAKLIYARSIDGVAAAIRDQRAAQLQAIEAEKSAGEQENISAKKNLAKQIRIRETTVALLEQAEAEARAANAATFGAAGGAGAGAAQAAYAGQLASVRKRAEDAKKSLADARKAVEESRITLAGEAASRGADPMQRIKKLYDDQVEAAKAKARAEGGVTVELTRQLTQIERNRQAALKAEQERQSAANRRPPRDPDLATPASVTKLLRSALPGVQITSTTGGKHTAGSDHYKGGAIDFVPRGGVAAMSKDDVRRLFEQAGIPIRRNAAGVEQLFGPGDKGHVDHFHVAWEKGKLALDNYNASVRDGKQAAAEAEREQKQLEASFDAMLKALDPAAAALGRYNDRLDNLAKLQKAGKLTLDQQVDYGRDAKAEYDAAQSKASNDNFRTIFGDAAIDAVLADFDANIAATGERFAENVRQSSVLFGDNIRFAIDSAADLFGIRVSGPIQRLLQPGGIEGQSKEVATSLLQGLRGAGLKIDDASMAKLTEKLGTVLGNASYGQIGGSVFSSITGGKENKLGSSIGGVLGGELGKQVGPAIGKAIGGTLGKTLGGAAGPIGAIAGGILGNVIGGLFVKTKQASSTISFGSDGLYAGSAKGTGTAEKAAASASANSVVGSLNRIAEALGGDVTGAGSVSIGYRPGHKDGAYRVDTSGRGRLTGVLAFATEEEAIRAAIADALKDGVIGGISDASKRILAAGGDLEKAITRASLIEAIPKSLKQMLDPVGAAVDELNRKFKQTVDALNEGGASAEQMAQAQKLYDLQLAEVKNSTRAASAELKDFLASMKVGNASPLSLRDQEIAAKAALAPFLDQIAAGKSIDQAKYQSAAQSYLDVERQLYGSTQGFFDAFDAVQASTAKAIAAIDNAVPVAAGVPDPFTKATATSTEKVAANTQTQNEMQQDTNGLLGQIHAILERVAVNTAADSGEKFIGSGRAFTNVRAV